MPKLKAILLATAFGLTMPGLALAQSDTAETATPDAETAAPEKVEANSRTVLATVNGTEITMGHVYAALANLSEEERRLAPDVLLQGLTERLIQQEALSSSADGASRAVELRLENDRRAMIAAERVQNMAAELEITDEEVKALYDERFADFTPATEYNAAHILVATEDEAKAIVTELEGGADFAELAKEKSTGPSGPGGGKLGWFSADRMVAPFSAAVAEMEPGAISAPVKTDFGWHVIKLEDTRIPEVPPLEAMEGELRNEALREKLFKEVGAIADSATIERADLSTIDAEALRNPDLLSD